MFDHFYTTLQYNTVNFSIVLFILFAVVFTFMTGLLCVVHYMYNTKMIGSTNEETLPSSDRESEDDFETILSTLVKERAASSSTPSTLKTGSVYTPASKPHYEYIDITNTNQLLDYYKQQHQEEEEEKVACAFKDTPSTLV